MKLIEQIQIPCIYFEFMIMFLNEKLQRLNDRFRSPEEFKPEVHLLTDAGSGLNVSMEHETEDPNPSRTIRS